MTKAEVYTGGNPSTGSGYTYLGSLRYTRTGNTRQLESTPFAAGRFVKNTGGMQPYYHITDHLGSIRVITDKNGTVQEQNDYYPYGGRHTSGNTYAALPGNNHKFNGKEEQTTANIDYLDYGARMYDNVTGRWGTPDPLAEKYKSMSPYNYCLNNPVMFVDPDGREVYIYFKNKQGKQEYFKYYGQEMNSPHPNQFVNDVITALNYNIKNGGGDPSRTAVYNRSIKIAIAQVEYHSVHDAQGGVLWSSEYGAQYENAVVSPATILDHELDHAIQFKTNYRKWVEDRYNIMDTYKNAEEKRVITGSEQKTARANGELVGNEPTRKSHNGKTVATYGPISNKIDREKTKLYESKK